MRFIIYILLAFLCLMSSQSKGQNGWTDQTPTTIDLTDTALKGIWAIDSENIWVVGQHGTILHSMNGGEDWVKVNTDYTDDYNSIIFLNSDTGFITGTPRTDDYAFVLKTVDAGITWKRDRLPGGSNQIAFDLEFYYSESTQTYTIYATGGLWHVWKTQDIGENWSGLSGSCGNGNFNACCFITENIGWFVGTPANTLDTSIVKTIDGGNTFFGQVNPNSIKLNEVSFISPNVGIAVGLENQILYTNDGGTNWVNRTDLVYHRWWSCDMKESGNAWAVGKDGKIAFSTDFFESWNYQNSGQSGELWKVYFIDDNEGWILGGGIGKSGIILHTKSGGIATSINQKTTETPAYLAQNYPNPFSQVTEITFSLSKISKIQLDILNINGQLVRTLVTGTLDSGIHKVKWDSRDSEGKQVSEGTYLYRLSVGEIVETKSMVRIQ